MPGLSMIDRQRKTRLLKAAEPKRHIKKLTTSMPGLSMIDRKRKVRLLKAAEPKRHIKKLFADNDDDDDETAFQYSRL